MAEPRRPTFDADENPRELLTPREIKELLAPIRGIGGDRQRQEPSVLLVVESPEDAETVTRFLRRSGVRTVPVGNRFTALDYFRRASYRAVISETEVLGPNPSTWFERLREIDPKIRLGFITEAGQHSSLAAQDLTREGPVIERPLNESALARLFGDIAGVQVTDEPDTPGATTEGTAVPPAMELEPLDAVRRLLESRVRGEDLRTALRQWLRADRHWEGWTEVERPLVDEVVLRVQSRSGHRPSGDLVRDAAALAEVDLQTAVDGAGSFLLFDSGGTPRGAIGLWRPTAPPAELALLAKRIAPILALVAALPTATTAPFDTRQLFMDILANRMHACRRRAARMAVLVAENGAINGSQLRARLAPLLRACDWIQISGERIYVLLDAPERGVFAALGERLQALAESASLRIAGSTWRPPEEQAVELVKRTEAMLTSKTDTPLFEFDEGP